MTCSEYIMDWFDRWHDQDGSFEDFSLDSLFCVLLYLRTLKYQTITHSTNIPNVVVIVIILPLSSYSLIPNLRDGSQYGLLKFKGQFDFTPD